VFQKAISILKTNRSLLDRAAGDLLAKETMSGEDLRHITEELVPAESSTKGAANVAA
jgi:hypothetical protein